MKVILDAPPDLILVSDQVASINASSFPGEVESWAGKDRQMPPLVLITSQDITEFGRYVSVLKKPFSPQALQAARANLRRLIVPRKFFPILRRRRAACRRFFMKVSMTKRIWFVRRFKTSTNLRRRLSLNIPQQNKNQQSAPPRKTPESGR
jgi:hypothetical protein